MHLYNEDKPYIFISYAHKNSEKVVPILMKLQQEGYNFWYDEGIEPGSEWDEFIANKITNCSYFIAFVSNAYVQSKNCKDELNYARDLDKELLLIYLEEVNLPAGMAMRLNRIQAINWYLYDERNISDSYQKLYTTSGMSITKLVEEQPLQPSAPVSSVPQQTSQPVNVQPVTVASPHTNLTAGQTVQTPQILPTVQTTPTTKESPAVRPSTTKPVPATRPATVTQPSSVATAFSILSLCIGVFSLLTSFCFGGLLGIVGCIFGVIAIVNHSNKYKTMAIWGTTLSALAFAVSMVLLIFSMIASSTS